MRATYYNLIPERLYQCRVSVEFFIWFNVQKSREPKIYLKFQKIYKSWTLQLRAWFSPTEKVKDTKGKAYK